MASPHSTPDPDHARIFKLANTMPSIANKSLITHKHAATVLVNGLPAASGVNTMRGQHPYHAETDAIRSFLIARGYLGYVKTCRILQGVQPAKVGEEGTTQYPAIAIEC